MKKERKLDRLYTEFEKQYSGKSQEEMTEIISDLEKEVAGKESSLEGLEGEKRESLQKDIEQGKKRLENLRGYSKNKTQIEGIRKYKVSLEKKLEQEIATRSESKELLEQAIKDLEEVSKKLADEKYTMTLDQDEYNALLGEKARSENEKKLQEERYLKSSKRITELQSKIGKCNLAWKSLFVNKSWDDIQRIALEPNTRYTRKVDSEKELPLSVKGREKQDPRDIEENIVKEIAKNVKELIVEEKKEESTALVEKKEGFFRKIWNKLKNWINGEEKENKIVSGDKEEEVSHEQDTTDKKEEVSPEREATVKKERDAFLEGLRQHVDVEYRRAVKEEKEQQYNEAHKVHPKEENTEEQETSR